MQKKIYPQSFKEEVVKYYQTNHTIAETIKKYGISDLIDTTLVMKTFDDAYNSRGKPNGLMFHSDQGVQYTAYAFRKRLRELHITQSFSTPGTPYDNPVCESFFHTLKKRGDLSPSL